MSSFLFTAVNRTGKSVTERIEAENLSQAKYKLEIQGYSEITFYESELSNEATDLFGNRAKEAKKKFLKNQVGLQYDTRIRRTIFNQLKIFSILIAYIFYCIFTSPGLITFIWLGGITLAILYLSFPVIMFDKLYAAHSWGKNSKVRFWANTAKFFNNITINKIPSCELDVFLSCADAREGNIDIAVMRMMKYQNDPKVSKRIFNNCLVRIYGSAKDFDKVLGIRENSLREGNIYTEELLDYALCLARRHKQTIPARETLQKVFDQELTLLANLFIPYCQGVIEVEDGNFPQAEFYLQQASNKIAPFEKNSHLVGLRSEIKAFLAITLGRLGEKDKAVQLLKEARPYLAAHSEQELLLECENSI